MGKAKKPLFSLEAHGTIADALTYQQRSGAGIVRRKPVPADPKSLAQLSWRHMYQKALALWHALSPAEQRDWNSQASHRGMTGFAWFMSQALKPNPGLYLPLQGGTMSGDIDMSKHKILRLPLPTDTQEPATKAYHDNVANLPTHGAGKHTDVTRQLFVPPGNHYTGAATFKGNHDVISLDPDADEYVYFEFEVPSDFVAFADLYLKWISHDSLGTLGNLWRIIVKADWKADGEAYNQHSETRYYNPAVTAEETEYVSDLTSFIFANLTIGDTVGVKVLRHGTHLVDDYESHIDIFGIKFSYTAEQ